MISDQEARDLRRELLSYIAAREASSEVLRGLYSLLVIADGVLASYYYCQFLPIPDSIEQDDCFLGEGGSLSPAWLTPHQQTTLRNAATEAIAPVTHLLATVRISAEDRSKCAYQPKPDAKYIRTSWTKFFRKIQPHLIGMTDADIERIQAELSTAFMIPDLEFRIHRGDAVHSIYRMRHDDGDKLSCMTGSPSIDLYARNQDRVGVVGIYKEGELMGRALLWDTDQGIKFLDRVYPSDGGLHIRAAMNWAKSQGWWYKTEHSIGGDWEGPDEMTVTLKDVDAYPYMDTFCFVEETPDKVGNFRLSTKDYDYGVLDRTDNSCPWDDDESPSIELLSGDYASRADDENGDVLYDEYADGYYWASANAFCENNQQGHYLRQAQVVSTLEGAYIHLGYSTGGWEQVTWGVHEGEWTDNYIYDDVNDNILTLTNTWRHHHTDELARYAKEFGWDEAALTVRNEFVEAEEPLVAA